MVEVRRATKEDADAIIDFYISSSANGTWDDLGLRFDLNDEKKWDGIRRSWSKGMRTGAIAIVDGKVVAAATFFKARKVYEPTDHNIELSWAVDKDHQGKGIGTKLVAVVLKVVKEAGYKRAEFRAEVDNPASWRVGEKNGFQREGTLKGAFKRPKDGKLIDLYIYGKLL